MNTIYFRNQNQVTLFRCELQGQLSDGHWENSLPRDHWTKPCGADVLVAENDTQLGCNFLPRRRYNFANKELLDVVADRMLHWVRITTAFPAYLRELDRHWDWDEDKITNPDVLALIANVNYTKKDLVRDLRDMSVIFNTMRSGVQKPDAPAKSNKPISSANKSTTLLEVKKFQFEYVAQRDVASVYSGKEGCRCGCLGKYYYAKEHQVWGGKNRGYEVKDEEVNDAMVAKVCEYMNAHPSEVEVIYDNEDCIFDIKLGNERVYTAYLNRVRANVVLRS